MRTDSWRPLVVSLALGAALTTAPGAAATAQRADATADACGPDSLLADLGRRNELPQTDVAPSTWYQRNWQGGWGPRAATYPSVDPPAGCSAVEWKRARVVAIARQYLGLPYRHHHIPSWSPPADLTGPTQAGPGLDCSNFTAWVYNFGLGLRFTSDIHQQAEGSLAPGRLLGPDEPLAPGDLLFILRGNRADVSHVVIYVDEYTVIDSHGTYGGVTEHPLAGWYSTHYSHARRVLE